MLVDSIPIEESFGELLSSTFYLVELALEISKRILLVEF